MSKLLAQKAINFKTLYQNISGYQNSPKITLSDSLSFGQILQQLLPYIYTAAGLILLVLIVVSGYNLMTSGSDPKKAAAAKAKLTTAFIGFAVVFFSYWMIQVVARIFNITELINLFS